jgi:two-component system CheB/CheR fusion protein
MSTPPPVPTAQRPDPFIVGIGASAGGIEALQHFFLHARPDSGAAYVVILHLSPDHDSQLATVLQHATAMPVSQVKERVEIEANHVYVVPPNRLLSLDRQSIVVSDITRLEQRRAPVDLFFRSLADAQGSRAVCVILSGTGPNGSSGLKRIKEYGGVVIAQRPEEAEYADMPKNAIATGLVDFVLPIADIPPQIEAYHARLRHDGDGNLAVRPRTDGDAEAMREILTVLRVRTGHDFSNYKSGTVRRRVERRIHLHNLPSLQAYARGLKENPDEAVALMRELLISVTHFFRDGAAWQALAERVIPRIFQDKSGSDQIRIWVPACATGEEAYSVAMLLAEHAAVALEQPALQVFATDLDEAAIGIAREAFYTDAEVADVSETRLRRFFTRENGGYRVRRDLRETVLFAHHNVIKDPPFSHLDLISCRNLLIYLNRAVQERVVETFHFALRPGGYLFLGGSETPDSSQDLFTPADKSAHIYESRTVTTRSMLTTIAEHSIVVPRGPARGGEGRPQDRVSPGELHQRLLERYGPPSVVITEEHNIVHSSEQAGRYLQVAGGEPTRDLIRLLRPDLRPEVRTALHQAVRERQTVEIKGINATLDDGVHLVDITVHPVLQESDPARGYLLVTFDEQGRVPEETQPRQLNVAHDTVTAQLEEEVGKLKQHLRSTIEQYETQVEEAKASNEELQAMNEELRSAAEELETSKEELQSVNEELTTVNQELKIKIEELGLTNNDFQNLINSSEIGTIFLDRHMRVKMSTPAANQIFNLLRTDVGRPLTDITSNLLYDDLHEDVQRVLGDLQTLDREMPTRTGRWIFTRLRPYRTTDDRIDGVVITFQDITGRRRAEEQVRQSEERLRLLIDGAIEYAIFTMTTDGVIDSWNSGAERMFGYRADEIIGKHFDVLFTAEDRAAGQAAQELATARETGRAADERFHVRRDGSRFYCSAATIRLGETQSFAKIARDLSVQQQARDALRVVEAEFDSRMRERTDQLEAQVSVREAAHHHVSSMLRRIVTAQEDERARIARDLHDQLGQQLTALRLHLQRIKEQSRGDGAEVEQALRLTQQVDRDLDFLSWELRPAVLDDLGLTAALPLFVAEWSDYYRIGAEYQTGRYTSGMLGRDSEVVFYRVAQEALNNVVKHAHATRVDVLLEARDGSVVMVIEDNGVGFDPLDSANKDKGIGLVGMQERARLIGATLDVESREGDGTSVFLRAPLAGGEGSGEG